jgi:hypothetical protein
VKRQQFLPTAFGIPVLALMLSYGPVAVDAQQMEHSSPSPSTHLTIKTYEGKTLTVSPEELAALPHKSVSVFNAHSKANETYSGVPLADLLSKVGVPLGESVRGKLFLTGVVAIGD